MQEVDTLALVAAGQLCGWGLDAEEAEHGAFCLPGALWSLGGSQTESISLHVKPVSYL